MSTRSQLRFIQRSETAGEQSETDRIAQIYRHSDGYPDSVLRDLVQLKDLLDETRTERGPAYAAAQFLFLDTLSTMTLYVDEGRDRSIHANQPSDLLDPDNMGHLDQPMFLLGHGVENPADGLHGDEGYPYVVELPTENPFDEPTEWTAKVSDHSAFPVDGPTTRPSSGRAGNFTGHSRTHSQTSSPNRNFVNLNPEAYLYEWVLEYTQMISTAGLAVIDALSTGREATPVDLATVTEYSQTHIYEVLDDLLDAGLLVERRGPNNQRKVRIADHPVIEAYRTLQSELSHVEWADLLSPATLRVCWFLDEPRRVSEIAERLGITRQGVHKALSPLKHRAMLSPSGPEYAVSEDLAPLLAFAQAVVTHEHRSRARQLAPSATVEWCDPKRTLVRVQTAEDTDALLDAPNWKVTGLSRFEKYGLQFFLAGEPAFWYAPDEELTPADVVCHTLVLDSGSRRVSYAMLLIEKLDIDQETLTDTATWYELESTTAAMYQALQGRVKDADELPVILPSDSEFMALKEQYGVA